MRCSAYHSFLENLLSPCLAPKPAVATSEISSLPLLIVCLSRKPFWSLTLFWERAGFCSLIVRKKREGQSPGAVGTRTRRCWPQTWSDQDSCMGQAWWEQITSLFMWGIGFGGCSGKDIFCVPLGYTIWHLQETSTLGGISTAIFLLGKLTLVGLLRTRLSSARHFSKRARRQAYLRPQTPAVWRLTRPWELTNRNWQGLLLGLCVTKASTLVKIYLPFWFN